MNSLPYSSIYIMFFLAILGISDMAYGREAVQEFTEVMNIIQEKHVTKPKLKELVFNAVNAMEDDVIKRGYKYDRQIIDWASIGNDDKESFKLFEKAHKSITDITGISSSELVYAAINGALNGLNSKSYFITSEEYKDMQIESKRERGGTGLQLTITDGALTVVIPLENTPADKARLKAGDRIIKIDGESTKGLALNKAVNKLRGPIGTRITLTIERDGIAKDYILTRDIIKVESLKFQMADEMIGHITINQFRDDTSDKLKEALKGKKMVGLILDLRNNSGGLFQGAIDVSEIFVEKGQLIVTIKGRKEKEDGQFVSTINEKYLDFPMIVLVNSESYGSAEIVAAALQDLKRAIIIGTTTRGTVPLRSIIPLSDGSALALATSRYYRPSGNINNGIEPDIIVNKKEGEDAQFMAAKTALLKVAGLTSKQALKEMIDFLNVSGIAETKLTEDERRQRIAIQASAKSALFSQPFSSIWDILIKNIISENGEVNRINKQEGIISYTKMIDNDELKQYLPKNFLEKLSIGRKALLNVQIEIKEKTEETTGKKSTQLQVVSVIKIDGQVYNSTGVYENVFLEKLKSKSE